MATPDQSKGGRSRDEVLAGEYVLGVLNPPERQEVEVRLRHDRQFAAIVRRWEDNLAHFNDGYAEEALPEVSFAEIERRIFGPGQPRLHAGVFNLIWNSLPVWRGLCLIVIGAFAFLFGLDWASRLRPDAGQELSAELTGGQTSPFALLARYEASSGRLSLSPIAGGNGEDKSLELWLMEGEKPARSLGVLPKAGEATVRIPEDLRTGLADGTVLAVSAEPVGGSRTGSVTGPILATGEIHR